MYQAIANTTFTDKKGKPLSYKKLDKISDEDYANLPDKIKIKFHKLGTSTEQRIEKLEKQSEGKIN